MIQNVLIAYPKYEEPFDVHTDASNYQINELVSQNGKPEGILMRWCRHLTTQTSCSKRLSSFLHMVCTLFNEISTLLLEILLPIFSMLLHVFLTIRIIYTRPTHQRSCYFPRILKVITSEMPFFIIIPTRSQKTSSLTSTSFTFLEEFTISGGYIQEQGDLDTKVIYV